MLDPAVGVRREVWIVGTEDDVSRDVFFELHQKAALADVDYQRIERLHPVELVRGDLRLAERRHAEIDHPELQGPCAKAAGWRRGGVVQGIESHYGPQLRHVVLYFARVSKTDRNGASRPSAI